MRSPVALLIAFVLFVVAAPLPARAPAHGHAERLVARVRRGDRLARATLVEDHMGLVRAVAWRYRGLGLPTEDLVQEGAIGLLDAVDGFDADRGASFSTFAFWRVRAAMTHALTAKGGVIRVPRTAMERGEKVISVPLDGPLADGTEPIDRLVDDPSRSPEAQALRKLDIYEVRAAVRRLGSRQRSIIRRHFGIGQPPETLAQIAADLRLSTSRIQRLEERALQTLASDLADAI